MAPTRNGSKFPAYFGDCDRSFPLFFKQVSTQSRLLIGQAFQKQHSETPVYVAELKDLNSPLEADDLTYYENVELSLGSPTLLESDLLHMRQKVTDHEFRQSSVTYLVRSGE